MKILNSILNTTSNLINEKFDKYKITTKTIPIIDLNQPFISKRQLKVEKIDPKDYPEARKTALLWSRIAQQKAAEVTTLPEEVRRFQDCSSISSSVSWALETPLQHKEIYLCKDKEERAQGMIVLRIEDTKIYVSYLVTHPRNIRSSVNKEDPEKVEGAGSALIEKSQKLAFDLKKDQVYLYALDSAKPFYQKLGFEETWPHSNSMYKSADKIASELTPLLASAA